jgi:mono/diheme cytochrome c family protein
MIRWKNNQSILERIGRVGGRTRSQH